jgi:hypothetical protein
MKHTAEPGKENIYDMFPIKNGFIQDALSSMLFSSALE